MVAGSTFAGFQLGKAQSSPSSNFTISSGVYPGAPTYTIWTNGTYCYAKDAYGSIDYQGVNAGTVIQNAFNNPPTTGINNVLLIGAFTLTLASGQTYALNVPSNTTFEIDGKLTMANAYSATNAQFIQVVNRQNVEIFGGQGELDGNGINQASGSEMLSGIFVSGSTNVKIHDLYGHNFGYTQCNGWVINLGYGTQNFTIYNMICENCGTDGIALNNAAYGKVNNCQLDYNARYDTGGNGIWINSDHIVVSNIIGHYNGWGTVRVEAFDQSRSDVTLSNIQSYYDSVVGISIDKHASGSWTLSNVQLSNFYILGAGSTNNAGLEIVAPVAGQVFGITISNGKIDNSAGYDIHLSDVSDISIVAVDVSFSWYDGLSASSVTRLQVTSGVYTNNGLSGLYTASGLTLSSVTQSTISGVYAYDYGSPAKEAWGLREIDSSSVNIITGCNFNSPGTSGGISTVSAFTHVIATWNSTSWISAYP